MRESAVLRRKNNEKVNAFDMHSLLGKPSSRPKRLRSSLRSVSNRRESRRTEANRQTVEMLVLELRGGSFEVVFYGVVRRGMDTLSDGK